MQNPSPIFFKARIDLDFIKEDINMYKYIYICIKEQRRKTIRIDLYSRRVSAIEPPSGE